MSVAFYRIDVPRDQLLPGGIEEVVAQHTGQTVSLLAAETRVSPLTHLDRYSDQRQLHEQDQKFGFGVKAFFDRIQIG